MASDFLPFASESEANVLSQTDWAADLERLRGFQSGVARSAAFNKLWRQCSTMAAALGRFVSDRVTVDVIDDGNIANLAGLIGQAVALSAGGGLGGVNEAPIDSRMYVRMNGGWTPLENLSLDGGEWT